MIRENNLSRRFKTAAFRPRMEAVGISPEGQANKKSRTSARGASFWLVLGLGAMLIFAYGWIPGGLDVDSCNYAVIAKEIVRTHHWLGLYDPVYGGVFYYHFPLTIWITALLFKFFGVSTFTAKLFSMFCGFALTGALFYFGKALKNSWVGFFAALSFLLTNHIVRLSRQCRMDIPVSLFIALAIFSFILAQKKSRLYYLLFGLFTSLAIMAKDCFGLFPLGIVILYLAIRLKWKEFFQPLFLAGVLIAFAPVVFWIWLDKSALFTPWFRWNFLHLLKSPSFHVPWYYYPWAILTKYFYFLPFAVYGGYLAVKEARQNKNYEPCMLIIWALSFPLAFSFGKQKLHYFILPMYPAASLLAGMSFDKILNEDIKLKVAKATKYILIIAAIIMLSFPLNISSKRFQETVKLSPFIDQVLKEAPEYEFINYRQDTAALLFYSQELKKVKSLNEKEALENALSQKEDKPIFCYLSEQDFSGLSPAITGNYRIILKYKDKVVITNSKDTQLAIPLP